MKTSCTTERLKEIMRLRNLRQVDIVDLCKPFSQKYNIKMNKSDISQYLAGKTEPNQDKLAILSMALNVNETWLMGFDVPMERTVQAPIEEEPTTTYQWIARKAERMNEDDQEKLKKMIEAVFDYVDERDEKAGKK